MKKPGRRQAKSDFKGKAQSKPNDTREPEQFELLPPPPFNPAWPNEGTLPGEAHARMLRGERLTQPKFGTHRWRLAAYIKELHYLGWPVKHAPVHDPSKERPIKEYWYSTDTIMAAKAMRGVK